MSLLITLIVGEMYASGLSVLSAEKSNPASSTETSLILPIVDDVGMMSAPSPLVEMMLLNLGSFL